MAQAIRIMGADKVKDLSEFYGGDPKLEVDPAIDLSLINRSVIELYTAFREPIMALASLGICQKTGLPMVSSAFLRLMSPSMKSEPVRFMTTFTLSLGSVRIHGPGTIPL